MTAVIFVPTYRPGGLDVLEASLARQTYKDFVLVVADELLKHRAMIWDRIENKNNFNIIFVEAYKKENNKRNLCEAYNQAAEVALDIGAELFVSLQDYIYVPEDGLQRFIRLLYDAPNIYDMFTGVTHISMDPFPTKVKDLNGLYTIFEEPFMDKPKRISWQDVRVSEIYKGFKEDEIIGVEPAHWEANWAAVPTRLLDQGIRWDTTYDRGIAYENMDFARRCNEQFGSQVWLDTGNVAISLPHKDYFSGEREEIEEFSNRNMYEERWMK